MSQTSKIVCRKLDLDRFAGVKTQIVDVYRKAFSLPPNYCDDVQVAHFGHRFEQHIYKAGFKFVAAYDDKTMVGFCYGYTTAPGQFWHTAVCQAVKDDGLADRWLNRGFEVCELAVAPERSREGIGSSLLKSILRDLPQTTVTLTTRTKNYAALGLYKKAGFKIIADDIEIPEIAGIYTLLARDLPCD